MLFLALLPTAAGYSHKPSAAVVSRVPVDGGFDVRRVELEGVTELFTVQYTVGPLGFAYLNDFVADYFAAPTWFHALLVGLPTNGRFPLGRFAVQIMPDSMRVSEVSGRRFVVTMQLEGYLDDAPYLTSWLYPVPVGDSIGLGLGVTDGREQESPKFAEDVPLLLGIVDGSLRELQVVYKHPQEDQLDLVLGMASSGTLRDVLLKYTMPQEDEVSLVLGIDATGKLKEALIDYPFYAPETVNLTLGITSGSLV